MNPPMHRAGSVVEVRETPETCAAGEDGRRGTVLQVRRLAGGAYEYGVGHMDDGEEGGLYPEEWLEATGDTHPGLAVEATGRRGVSTRVSEEGDLLGRQEYEIVEEVVA